jgi:hypothetical protein
MIGLVLLVLLGLYVLGGLMTVAHFWKKYGPPGLKYWWVVLAVFGVWPLAVYDERKGLL